MSTNNEEPFEDESRPIDPRATVNIDREAGSGSLTMEESWVAENERVGMNDGRSETVTTFYAWDVDEKYPSQKHRDPSDKRSWAELAKWNDGMWSPERATQNFEADKERWIEAFGSTLDLKEYQVERVKYILDDIGLSPFKPYRFSTEEVILGIISLIVDLEQRVTDIEDWTIDEWIVYDERFESLMRDIEMVEDDSLDRNSLWQIRDIIKSETDFFDN